MVTVKAVAVRWAGQMATPPGCFHMMISLQVGGAYGYCEGGSCEVGGANSHASWAVGLALSLFFYLVLTLCFLWFYCRYTL
jgi:hypothetical protein